LAVGVLGAAAGAAGWCPVCLPLGVGGEEVGGGELSQEDEGFGEVVLFDQAVGGEVSAGGVRADQVVLGQEVVRARVVPGGEVDLG
jgi:hypothetical protein